MRAAASLGYNAYVTNSPYDNLLEKVSSTYKNNIKRAVGEAKKLGISLIPQHFYQGDAVYDNYALAEAFPVRGTKFKVVDNLARAIQDHQTNFQNGGFESHTGGKPDEWRIYNIPGAAIEEGTAKSGNACLRLSGGGLFARINQKISLKPYRAYRLSAWVKSRGCTDCWRVARFRVYYTDREFLLDKRYRPFGTPRDKFHDGIQTTLSTNQNWTYCQTDFNSLAQKSAWVEFVVSPTSPPTATQKGTVWLDEIKLEEVGLYETIRSRTRPVVVTSIDASTTYHEGTDYIVDPKCNSFTDKSFNYQGHLQIPQGSSIQNGQELRVSWYQMSDVEQVKPEANFCLPETFDALRDNLLRMEGEYGEIKRLYMGFDEWRTAFWDDRCELFPKAKTAGEYLAGALDKSLNLLWETDNCRELYMWSDMYDPHFNAWKPYAMTNGGCLNSWKDMDTNLIIVNWNACGSPWDEMSLRFFMGLDDSFNPEGKVYRQIVSVQGAGAASKWLPWIEKAEKEGGRGVIGINYVDWNPGTYSHMELVKNVCLAHGRWGKGPLPETRCVGIKSTPSAPEPKGPDCKIQALHSAKQFRFQFHLNRNSRVNLKILDLHGRQVGTIASRELIAGRHDVRWNASSLSSGVFFISLEIDGVSQATRKLIML